MKKLLPTFAIILSFFCVTPSFGWDYDVLFGTSVTPGETADQHKDACTAGIGDNEGSVGACAPAASPGPVADTPCNLVGDFGGKTGTWDCPKPDDEGTPLVSRNI